MPKLARILNQISKLRSDRNDRLAYNDTPVALGQVDGQRIEVAVPLKRICNGSRHRDGRHQSVQKHLVTVQ